MKKRIIVILLAITLLVGIGSGIYFVLNKQDSKTTLTILEKQWIEDNKNIMHDFAVVNNLPIFNYDGEGLIYDFISSLEKTTGLEFNKMSYSYKTEVPSDYAFMIVDKKEKNDILVYQDNYALISKSEIKYTNIKEVESMKVGVLASDLESVNYYMGISTSLTFTSYETVEDLLEEFNKDKTELSAIILPKTMYMEDIISSKYYINYNITEMTKDYIIRLGDIKKLNTIIIKYFKKWFNENYDKSYSNYFSDGYFSFNEIDNDSQVNFKSKRYSYGFVDSEPYDKLVNNKLVGINTEILKEFVKIADVEITYKQYKTKTDLLNDFNANKIDFFFNETSINKFDMDVYTTSSIFDEKVVILSHANNEIIVNSVRSLKDNAVNTITNSRISEYLKSNEIEIEKQKNISTLLNKIKTDSVIALDFNTYEIFKNNELKNYIIRYTFDLDSDYNYVVKDIDDNKVFSNYFNFYLSFTNEKEIINSITYKNFDIEEKHQLLKNILYCIAAALLILIITIIIKFTKTSKTQTQGVSRENKLKYIDMLTCLKNRNYLNESIAKWDGTGIYPQVVIIVDLNNVAYINDNYGHSEGDSVITEAANILIKNQLEQSEIMRTNGNEFLIYLVGYEEKQIIAYIRRLNKEFKELAHGFGAAIGYSMIIDGLKTVDDAINEATLDMRANKEEANNQ